LSGAGAAWLVARASYERKACLQLRLARVQRHNSKTFAPRLVDELPEEELRQVLKCRSLRMLRKLCDRGKLVWSEDMDEEAMTDLIVSSKAGTKAPEEAVADSIESEVQTDKEPQDRKPQEGEIIKVCVREVNEKFVTVDMTDRPFSGRICKNDYGEGWGKVQPGNVLDAQVLAISEDSHNVRMTLSVYAAKKAKFMEKDTTEPRDKDWRNNREVRKDEMRPLEVRLYAIEATLQLLGHGELLAKGLRDGAQIVVTRDAQSGSPKREEQNATEIEEAEDSDGSAKGVAMLSNLFWREDSSTQGAVEPASMTDFTAELKERKTKVRKTTAQTPDTSKEAEPAFKTFNGVPPEGSNGGKLLAGTYEPETQENR